MARLLVTPRFRSDTHQILNYLERVAGPAVAEDYSRRIRTTVERLVSLPRSGAPRPAFGPATRAVLVAPYILFYDYRLEDDTVVLLRLLHGRRDITSRLLGRGGVP